MMNAAISSMTNSPTLRRSLPTLLQYGSRRPLSTKVPSKMAAARVTTPSLPAVHIPLQRQYSSLSPRRTNPRPSILTEQTRSLFIQTATTPNPESLKFIPNGRLVLAHNPEENPDTGIPGEVEVHTNNENDTNGFYVTRKDNELIARSPLVKKLFALDTGIKSIYLGYDFITVTKYAEAHWSHLQTPIFGAIMDFYASSLPAVRGEPEITDTTILEEDSEVVAMIKELLESRIRPAVQEDGGDIRYVGFEESTGIVTVQLAGSCVGCPSSSVTLKNGVENMLMHYIPEVTNVVSLEEEAEDDGTEESGEVKVEQSEGQKKMKTYEERLAAAGIPFSD